jgi:hypothetical protein
MAQPGAQFVTPKDVLQQGAVAQADLPQALRDADLDVQWAMRQFTLEDTRQAFKDLLALLYKDDRESVLGTEIVANGDVFARNCARAAGLPSALKTFVIGVEVGAAVLGTMRVYSEFIFPALRDWVVAERDMMLELHALCAQLSQDPAATQQPFAFDTVAGEFVRAVHAFAEATLVYAVVARLCGNDPGGGGVRGLLTDQTVELNRATDDLTRFVGGEGLYTRPGAFADALRTRFGIGSPKSVKALFVGGVGIGQRALACLMGGNGAAACAALQTANSAFVRYLSGGAVNVQTIGYDAARAVMPQWVREKASGAVQNVTSQAASAIGSLAGPVGAAVASTVAARAANAWTDAQASATASLDPLGSARSALSAFFGDLEGGAKLLYNGGWCAIGWGCADVQKDVATLLVRYIGAPHLLRVSDRIARVRELPVLGYVACFADAGLGLLDPGAAAEHHNLAFLPSQAERAQAATDLVRRTGAIDLLAAAFSGRPSTPKQTAWWHWMWGHKMEASVYANKERCDALRRAVKVVLMGGTVWYQASGMAAFVGGIASATYTYVIAPAMSWLAPMLPAEAVSVLSSVSGFVQFTVASLATPLMANLLLVVGVGVAAIVLYKLAPRLARLVARITGWKGLKDLIDGTRPWRDPAVMDKLLADAQRHLREGAAALKQFVVDQVPVDLLDARLFLEAVNTALSTATSPDDTQLLKDLQARLRTMSDSAALAGRADRAKLRGQDTKRPVERVIVAEEEGADARERAAAKEARAAAANAKLAKVVAEQKRAREEAPPPPREEAPPQEDEPPPKPKPKPKPKKKPRPPPKPKPKAKPKKKKPRTPSPSPPPSVDLDVYADRAFADTDDCVPVACANNIVGKDAWRRAQLLTHPDKGDRADAADQRRRHLAARMLTVCRPQIVELDDAQCAARPKARKPLLD